ncbi:MAG TPA: redoxin domain-containing protein [Sulfurivirga caldicuralii]|nr:redoxin domain-containing protein [Sulfurivirga caldicuralii]
MRFILLLGIILWHVTGQAQEITLPDETQINVEVVEAVGKPVARLLWLPSEYGLLAQERALAERLAQRGVESWLPQLFEAYFLSPSPSAVKAIPDESVHALLRQARAEGVPVYVVGTDRGAILALKAWQGVQQAGPMRHGALLLINPNLYVATPKPGAEAAYWPEAGRLNAPVYVFQAELSPWRWRLDELLAQLTRGGSHVFVHLLAEVRDRFYFRADANQTEQQAARLFPQQIARAMALLTPWITQPRPLPPAQAREQVQVPNAQAGKTATLMAYDGPPYPPLRLETLDGRMLAMEDLRGKVVLVNFWASWCPPCVHEMPSMAALKQALKARPFEILAINLAEDRSTIEAFLQEHPVNFPVLLDPSGTAVKRWRVFAYPSSYLLDKQGRIRYAAFGALDWHGREARALIETLLAE